MNKFNITKVSIQNFRSIQEEIILDIKPGLFCIEGINLDEPNAKNGSGKSTLISAIYWAITGNTLTTVNGEFMYLYEDNDVEELLDSIETMCINDINKTEHINECDCNCRKCWTNKLGI